MFKILVLALVLAGPGRPAQHSIEPRLVTVVRVSVIKDGKEMALDLPVDLVVEGIECHGTLAFMAGHRGAQVTCRDLTAIALCPVDQIASDENVMVVKGKSLIDVKCMTVNVRDI